MKNISFHFIDKSDWQDGPWKYEPDKEQWQDEETGLPCLIVRNDLGSLCGYVGVDSKHPYYEKDYDDVPVEAHGGLTFSSFCSGDEFGICHEVEKGEDDTVWWLGFDCAHSGDLCPSTRGIKAYIAFRNWETYKDINYVKEECKQLAKQLKDLA